VYTGTCHKVPAMFRNTIWHGLDGFGNSSLLKRISRDQASFERHNQTAEGDSLVLHCASLLRAIFAPLVCTHERVRVHVTDFPQTKLDSEINALFLLNEHGDPYFLFHKFNEDNILNNW